MRRNNLHIKIGLFLLMVLFYRGSSAQAIDLIKGKSYQVGEQLPGHMLTELKQRISLTKSVNSLENKYILLDFWGVNCIPCIAALPKLDSLQEQYSDQLAVVLVSDMPKSWLDSVIAIRKKYVKVFDYISHFASVNADTLLSKLFPHRLIPHTVIVSPEGKIRSITGGSYITAGNLARLFNDENFHLPQKIDWLDYDDRLPTMPQLLPTFPKHLRFYSAFLKYVGGLSGRQRKFVIDTADKTIRVSRIGTLLDLFADALSEYAAGDVIHGAYFDYGKRIRLEVDNPADFVYNEDPELSYDIWQNDHKFIYEAVLPLKGKDKVYEDYLIDLERYSGKKAEIKKEEVEVLSIVMLAGKDRIRYRGKDVREVMKTGIPLVYTDSTGFHINGGTISYLKNELNKSIKDIIVVDGTQYAERISLSLSSNLDDLESVRKELKEKYNLDIVRKLGEIEVLTITER